MRYHGVRVTAIVVLAVEDTIVSCDCGHFCQSEPGRGLACCVCLRLPKACRICDAEEGAEDGAWAPEAHIEIVSPVGE